jgi:trk system potassium uptake protein TrkH
MVRQRVRLTLHIIGSLLKYFALAYIVPLATALYYGEGEDWRIFLYSLLVTLTIGLLLEFGFRTDKEIERADGFTIVAFTWLLIPLLGTLPYVFLGLGFPDAFFEAMSGFTGTGATIFGILEELPKSVLLWRSLTQWLGGMGVIALFIAILPRLGVGGSQLFDREFPGAMPERLRPRFRTTARFLWAIYVGFTGAEIALLYFLSRLPLFDSICVSFSTLSTGGFTPTTANIASYANPLAEYIVMVFMFIGGMNFVVHYQVLNGNFKMLKDEEFRLYVVLLLGAMLLLAISQGLGSYRDGLFLLELRRQNGASGFDVHRGLWWLYWRGNKSGTGFNPDETYEGNDEEGYFPQSCDSAEIQPKASPRGNSPGYNLFCLSLLPCGNCSFHNT